MADKTIVGIRVASREKDGNLSTYITIHYTEPWYVPTGGYSNGTECDGVQTGSVTGLLSPGLSKLKVGDVVSGFAYGEEIRFKDKRTGEMKTFKPLVGIY